VVQQDEGDAADKPQQSPLKDDDDDGDEAIMPDFLAAESLNRGTDKTTEVIDATLKDVSPRYEWRDIAFFTYIQSCFLDHS